MSGMSGREEEGEGEGGIKSARSLPDPVTSNSGEGGDGNGNGVLGGGVNVTPEASPGKIKHRRGSGSMSQLPQLDQIYPPTMSSPDKVYSNDDGISDIEYSPRPKSDRHVVRERKRASLERYSTSILAAKKPSQSTILESKLEPITASNRDLEKKEEGWEDEPGCSFENYAVSEFGVVKSISEQEGILDLNERERVYNTLIYVPLQYERMLLFGLLLCLDSFLAVFTLVPLRAAYMVYLALCNWRNQDFSSILSLVRRLARGKKAEGGDRGAGKAGTPTKKKKKRKDQSAQNGDKDDRGGDKDKDKEALAQTLPDYLCDILWLALVFLSCYVLLQWKTSEAFHYIHAQEVIKLYVVLTMLEIFDKICGSLSSDCLETLAASCSMLLGGRSARGGRKYPAGKGGRADNVRVVVDFFVTLLVMCLHCLIIMLEAVAFNVVLNSASSSLLALLVSNNFAELKGTVFKNMNVTRLWTLSMQDIVEHFHISICLLFVLIENMLLTNAYLPSYKLAVQCGMVLGTEIVVDIMKHAFVGKFQNLKPGVYSEYLKDMCEKTVASSSINGYRIVKFNPLVPASILLRIAVPLVGRSWRNCASTLSMACFVACALCLWLVLFCLKLALGWSLQLIARRFLKYYSTTRKTKAKPWLLSSRKTEKVL
ncbi:Tapt1/CMV membrane protein receptor [Chloropicon primus]|nr:Tapt1/CMV membrane protein receptor [Chloropicon primus]